MATQTIENFNTLDLETLAMLKVVDVAGEVLLKQGVATGVGNGLRLGIKNTYLARCCRRSSWRCYRRWCWLWSNMLVVMDYV